MLDSDNFISESSTRPPFENECLVFSLEYGLQFEVHEILRPVYLRDEERVGVDFDGPSVYCTRRSRCVILRFVTITENAI